MLTADEDLGNGFEIRVLDQGRTDLTAEEATIDIARANAALQRAIRRLRVHGYAN